VPDAADGRSAFASGRTSRPVHGPASALRPGLYQLTLKRRQPAQNRQHQPAVEVVEPRGKRRRYFNPTQSGSGGIPILARVLLSWISQALPSSLEVLPSPQFVNADPATGILDDV
jgi:hypothetical protein